MIYVQNKIVGKYLVLVFLFSIAGIFSARASEVDSLLNEAREAIRMSDYRKSARILQVIIRDHPENMKAIQLLEDAFLIKVKREQIEQDLERYLKEKKFLPAQSQYQLLKREAPNHPKLDEYLSDIKKLEEAEKFSIERLNLSKKQQEERERYLKLAKTAMSEKEYRQAIGYFQKILETAPGDIVAQNGIRDAQKGLELDQKDKQIAFYINTGKEQFTKKSWLDAKKSFDQVLLIEPKHLESIEWLDKIDKELKRERDQNNTAAQAENFYQQGLSFMRSRQFDEAVDALEKAMLIIPNFRDSNLKIREALKMKEELRLQQERNRADAIAKYIKDGLIAYYSEDYETAIGFLGEALKIDPNNIQAKDTLERARDAQRLKSEEEVDSNSPFYPLVQTFASKGYNLFKQGKYRDAKQEWNEILQLFPKNRLAIQESLRCDRMIDPSLFRQAAIRIIDEGKKLLGGKQYRLARLRFQMILDIDPNYPGLSDLLRQTEQANKETTQAKLPRAVLNGYYQQALAYYRQRNYTQARDLMQRVVTNDPLNFEAASALARIQKLLSIDGGQNIRQQVGRQLTDAQKQQVRTLYLQGLTHYSNNNYKNALQAWRQVLAIDPGHREARSNISRVENLLKS